MGTNWKTAVLGSRPISRVKVDSKNYYQHFIKHDEDNNSKSKTVSWNQNYKRSSFYIKTLDRFQDNVRLSIFEHILNLNHCRVFETKPTFPFLSIIRFSVQSSLSELIFSTIFINVWCSFVQLGLDLKIYKLGKDDFSDMDNYPCIWNLLVFHLKYYFVG